MEGTKEYAARLFSVVLNDRARSSGHKQCETQDVPCEQQETLFVWGTKHWLEEIAKRSGVSILGDVQMLSEHLDIVLSDPLGHKMTSEVPPNHSCSVILETESC